MAPKPLTFSAGFTPGASFLIAVGAGLSAALLVLWLVGNKVFAAGFGGTAIVFGGAAIAWRSLSRPREDRVSELDLSLVRAVVQTAQDAIAITDRTGRLVCANDRYEAMFGGFPTPPELSLGDSGTSTLIAAGRIAWRDGQAQVGQLRLDEQPVSAEIARAGDQQDMLIWRFVRAAHSDRIDRLTGALAGDLGNRLGAAGIMAAMIAADGRILSANPVFRHRALGNGEGGVDGLDFASFLITDSRGLVRFEREGLDGNPLRLVQVPFAENDGGPILIAMLDDEELPVADGPTASSYISTLVSLMPVGIALVDREGRFLQMNAAFTRAAGIDPAAPPLYPGDLVVREDKAAVADAVRRFANGAAQSSDMAVRLRDHPDEPIALTIAGARGLGPAAVVLSLKDNSEESRLKREVAQATKMQAVGQLAGGVAHDFNNILTAILGHCDLMLMRHSPGDSDYDDIQQVRSNSNRAAGLTRQLLAFSRQQTLRPQILQLPDVVSEVSNLLKRLLGETVTLNVSHGRDLGPVRADPGQLEQVVVNLAVNARDAMLSRNPHGGGTLTIRTRAATIAEVRDRGDIMPAADYTTLEISDTGTGIPPEVLPKIFEPFFTTKEIGKGTGLGLSTVYGIVKQSGGYIFADSRPGQGATFTIYLPVHNAATVAPTRIPTRPKQTDLWGTGTVLLVEDEAMVRAVAERALSRQGYTVMSAENGEAALELLETCQAPDLLISDVVMPTMDGPTMARKVRDRFPTLPILFMSGYAEEQLRKSIDIGNVSFLPKPFSVQQLAEAAREALTQG
ncbi:response regulator [Sphingomonas sp. TX0543]|uniref:response regulator n=1 Tax=unclassified Sphingomonas TaxID=196159 RepID=UPI0010F616F8|nr:response regulator [Sphingomonas sp. 3P27F8]